MMVFKWSGACSMTVTSPKQLNTLLLRYQIYLLCVVNEVSYVWLMNVVHSDRLFSNGFSVISLCECKYKIEIV